MDTAELTAYLHRHIPLTRAMSVQVVAADPGGVTLAAPLAPNVNHRDTAFGGSVASLATLACWSLVTVRLRDEGIDARAVVRRADVDYIEPVDDDFRASCRLADEAAWRRMLRALRSRGRGRMALESELVCRGRTVARFSGEFAVLAVPQN